MNRFARRTAQLLGCIALCAGFSSAAQAANTLLKVGCPWFSMPISTQTYNTGYLDSHASYFVATLPTAPSADTQIIVEGSYPQVRYFSFQLSRAYSFSNLVDQLADADLTPVEGGAPNADPAALPDSNNYQNHYRVTIRFADPPAVREPNTLYAGTPAEQTNFPQVIFRRYLGNPGYDVLSRDDLPSLTYVGPLGTINFNNTPDAQACKVLQNALNNSQASKWAYNPFPALPTAVFTPVWFIDAIPYPNADSAYLQALPSTKYAPLVVIRVKLPVTPLLPPETNTPDVRYWSICQYELHSTAMVGCLADTEVTAQADGYAVFVISPPAQRPALATQDAGYNWIDWGDQPDAYVALREILPSPGFLGSYQLANNTFWLPLKTTIGDFAPQSTYCDPATFAANATAGGQPLIDACRSAYAAALAARLKQAHQN